MPNPVNQSHRQHLTGGVQHVSIQDMGDYCFQGTKAGAVYVQFGMKMDPTKDLHLIKNYKLTSQDIAWLNNDAETLDFMPDDFGQAFYSNFNDIHPVQPEEPKGERSYDPQMIAALQDLMNVLDILAKKDETFRPIQTKLQDAVRQEIMPITLPGESYVASTPSPRPTQNVATAPEAPLSDEEHLAVLIKLQGELRRASSYDHKLPVSVCQVLNQLEAQVDASIQIVADKIAQTKNKQQELKNKFTSRRGDFMPTREQCHTNTLRIEPELTSHFQKTK